LAESIAALEVELGALIEPITVVLAVDIGPGDAPLFGVLPEVIEQDGEPDIGVVLSGTSPRGGPLHLAIIQDRGTGQTHLYAKSDLLGPLVDKMLLGP
jgi:hypothetical protein